MFLENIYQIFHVSKNNFFSHIKTQLWKQYIYIYICKYTLNLFRFHKKGQKKKISGFYLPTTLLCPWTTLFCLPKKEKSKIGGSFKGKFLLKKSCILFNFDEKFYIFKNIKIIILFVLTNSKFNLVIKCYLILR